MATLARKCSDVSDQAIIETADRYGNGEVKDQSKKYAPTVPEFVEEVRRRQEFIEVRARPRLAAPVYQSGRLAPFQVARQKALTENAHLPVIAEDITYEQFKRLSETKQIPVGAKWVACLGTIFGPAPAKQAKAA